MVGEHHNLATEFPEFKEKIHELKMNDHHFQRLMDEHHEVDKNKIVYTRPRLYRGDKA